MSLAKPKRRTIWGTPFDQVNLRQTIDYIEGMIESRVPGYVITANLNYVMLNAKRPSLSAVTRDANLIVADGQPIVWRSKLGGEPLPERVAGSEMIFRLAQRASQKRWKVYFLGGEPGVGSKCAARLAQMYPGMQIAGVESPPFRALSDQEQLDQDARIQDARPDILLVAFGQPKGEQWIHANHRRLGVPVSIQLGASFDFVAGTAQRAPAIWQKTGMEWCYRMMSDPKRLVPRYAGNALFLATALAQDWKAKVIDWGLWSGNQQSIPSRSRIRE